METNRTCPITETHNSILVPLWDKWIWVHSHRGETVTHWGWRSQGVRSVIT